MEAKVEMPPGTAPDVKLSKLVAQFQQELTLTTRSPLRTGAVTANLTYVNDLLAQTRALVVKLEVEQEKLLELERPGGMIKND
jgi:hypothetical protein